MVALVRLLMIAAGAGQLALAAASLAIPRVLGWRGKTAVLDALTRSVFWTYAAYIWAFNVSFGVVSAFRPDLLLDGTALARSVAGFIGAYWGARVVIQFASFGKHAPPGLKFKFAEAALVVLFVGLTAVYGLVAAGWR